jgi:hypothetical protein
MPGCCEALNDMYSRRKTIHESVRRARRHDSEGCRDEGQNRMFAPTLSSHVRLASLSNYALRIPSDTQGTIKSGTCANRSAALIIPCASPTIAPHGATSWLALPGSNALGAAAVIHRDPLNARSCQSGIMPLSLEAANEPLIRSSGCGVIVPDVDLSSCHIFQYASQ